MTSKNRIGRAAAFCSLVAATALAAGCGSKERVVSVAGTVTHNGQPVPGIVVSFVPEAAAETGVSIGETDASGRYSVTVVKTGASGAVVGKHKVWVSAPREPLPDDKELNDDQSKERRAKARKQGAAALKPPAEIATILKKYGNLDASPLTVEVKDGSPIDLVLD